jgi:alcohol dehydrogenase, propanol-preferring
VNSYDLKPDVDVLATDSSDSAMKRITDVVKGDYYPGLDATVLATDHPPAPEFAANITRKHGTVVLLGQPEKGITISYLNIIYRDLRLVGSLVAANTPDAVELVKLVADHNIKAHVKKWKLEDAEKMRQEYLSGKSSGKNVIVLE